jgi:hypothetical protein
MLKFLKRWLGWDSDTNLFDFSSLTSRSEPRPSEPPPAVRTPPATPQTRPAAQNTPPAKPKPKERNPLDVLDNPRLTLDKPKDDGFDPYNTGAFNRSTSWEKIGRQRKR